jgi:hypothetical protein
VFDGLYSAQLGTTDLETLSQQFSVVAGDTYSLSYWLQGDPASRLDIFNTTFGGLLPNIQLNPSTSWTEYFLQFTAPLSGNATLSFSFIDTNGNFLSLDDVDVEDVGILTIGQTGGADTPEPSSLLLLGTGICGLAVITRRRLFDPEVQLCA